MDQMPNHVKCPEATPKHPAHQRVEAAKEPDAVALKISSAAWHLQLQAAAWEKGRQGDGAEKARWGVGGWGARDPGRGEASKRGNADEVGQKYAELPSE